MSTKEKENKKGWKNKRVEEEYNWTIGKCRPTLQYTFIDSNANGPQKLILHSTHM
jgi:hypothetical protein